ncbi:unnamed protein product, partial [Laminaria digitata]
PPATTCHLTPYVQRDIHYHWQALGVERVTKFPGAHMVLSERSVGDLRQLKGHVDKGYLSNSAEIALMKDHLLANREVPPAFWSSTEALGQLKAEDFITEEQHAPQISALVQDAVSSSSSSSSSNSSGATSARTTAVARPQPMEGGGRG